MFYDNNNNYYYKIYKEIKFLNNFFFTIWFYIRSSYLRPEPKYIEKQIQTP